MNPERFIGTWKLLTCEHRLATGGLLHPLGTSPHGIVIYSTDGYMNVGLMRGDRRPFRASELFGGSLEEKAAAAESYVAYGGRYEIHPDRVVHHVEVSLFPNWVGSRQQRFYEFKDGGRRLLLSTNEFIAAGVAQTAHLLWERA